VGANLSPRPSLSRYHLGRLARLAIRCRLHFLTDRRRRFIATPAPSVNETILPADEVGLKQASARMASIKERGTIMWDYIISLIYDRSCQKYLADVARHQHRWI
jgi:hypothetical protein